MSEVLFTIFWRLGLPVILASGTTLLVDYFELYTASLLVFGIALLAWLVIVNFFPQVMDELGGL